MRSHFYVILASLGCFCYVDKLLDEFEIRWVINGRESNFIFTFSYFLPLKSTPICDYVCLFLNIWVIKIQSEAEGRLADSRSMKGCHLVHKTHLILWFVLQISLDGYGTADHKRNSDSILFQRLFHPLPTCEPAAHASSGFHDVFEAIRTAGCRLKSLNVSKCQLGAEDALCLGETVRRSTCLDALKLEGGTRLGEVSRTMYFQIRRGCQITFNCWLLRGVPFLAFTGFRVRFLVESQGFRTYFPLKNCVSINSHPWLSSFVMKCLWCG